MEHWFLDSEFPNAPDEEACFHVIPFPLEETVSYMGGTKDGPEAILAASGQLEQLVEGYGNPGRLGIHTTKMIDTTKGTLKALESASQAVLNARSFGAVPIILGGEHTVTNACADLLLTTSDAGILQFDAHMDLRDIYDESPFSHACVMRRLVEKGIRLFQIGIRNFSEEDLEARQKYQVGHYDASFLYRTLDKSSLRLPESFPKNLYITFDVDGLDASLMSATGTPDPGGLLWWDAVTLLESLTEGRRIIGFDVVELAPNMLHHPSYTAAKLLYFMMGLAAKRNA